jgi:hypothetical protein
MFRIYTEDRNRWKVKAILNRLFGSYTLLYGIGAWKGRNEHSMIIELDGVSRVKVRQAACEIKKVNSQDAVMVQEIAAETQFV